jgi:hypothetical protein
VRRERDRSSRGGSGAPPLDVRSARWCLRRGHHSPAVCFAARCHVSRAVAPSAWSAFSALQPSTTYRRRPGAILCLPSGSSGAGPTGRSRTWSASRGSIPSDWRRSGRWSRRSRHLSAYPNRMVKPDVSPGRSPTGQRPGVGALGQGGGQAVGHAVEDGLSDVHGSSPPALSFASAAPHEPVGLRSQDTPVSPVLQALELLDPRSSGPVCLRAWRAGGSSASRALPAPGPMGLRGRELTGS